MKAIIPAAGTGSRLKPYTDNIPKSLVSVKGRPLIKYSLDNLSDCGIEEVIIIVGFQAEKYKSIIGERHRNCSITYLTNNEYDSTDVMYSVWLAKEYIFDGFILLLGDLLFHKDILSNLIDIPYENVCTIDYNDDLSPTVMKTLVNNDEIISIGRNLESANSRSIGMYKYSALGAKIYFQEIEKFIEIGSKNLKIEPPLVNFLKYRNMNAIETGNLPWIEIDFPIDYEYAIENIDMIIGNK